MSQRERLLSCKQHLLARKSDSGPGMDEIHLVGDTLPVGASQWPEIYILKIQGSCSLTKLARCAALFTVL